MSLTDCPACKKQVSKKADICPSCGHPLRRGFFGRPGGERILNVGCLIIVMVFAVLFVLYSFKSL